MHIACSCDARFAADCAVMLSSLVATQSVDGLSVHLLHDVSLPGDDRDALSEIVVNAGAQFEAISDMRERTEGGQFKAISDMRERTEGVAESTRFPLSAWYRVLLPELLPDLPRVLYLDADTLVVDELAPLWKIDMEDKLVGAVTNPLLDSMVPRVQTYLGVPNAASYFNSGVLLIDLAGWRKFEISRAVIEFARSHPAISWPDQDALNGVLHASRLPLHPRWNAMPGLWNVPQRYLPHTAAETREAKLNPAIVHFVGDHKPWHYRNRHPYRARYFAYLNATPWRGRPIEGRSVGQALLKPLPWLWAFHIESSVERGSRRYSAVRRRFGGLRRRLMRLGAR